ncbi:hypothetical protein WHR41_02255 [Cladosporium halotolerans]|uniref:Brl1/Brr6 domain-containing protein n=1 Tax=Cladosporium halotolerans TaxID=1052096 RepID=A0AB34KZM6_9PEZI
MSKRYHESPMDFEYQNGTGPLDARSPFAAVSMNSQRFPATPGAGRKRDMNAFDSPTRAGASRTTSPTKPLPPVPAFNSLFATPRKTTQDVTMEDSSAGETPKSPERQDDSEVGTPAERPPSKKESFFGRFKKQIYSPGRGEIPRGDIVQSKEKRIRRQRSREAQRQLAIQARYSMSGSGSEAENDDSELVIAPSRTVSPRKRSANYNSHNHQHTSEPPQTPQPAAKEPHWMSSLFTFIGAHPTVPHILTFYAQLAFNTFLLGACAYMIYCFWTAIQDDINKKAWDLSADIIANIADATENFRINGCASATRAPALKVQCDAWAKLMGQDPMKIARAKVSAHTFAEIFNSFVEPISYKAMLFTALLIFGCFATSNFAFGVLRNKAMEQQHQQAAAQHFWAPGPPPPTPQRSFSGMAAEGPGAYGGTPWHGKPALEPAPSRGFEIGDGQGSPRRRLIYN